MCALFAGQAGSALYTDCQEVMFDVPFTAGGTQSSVREVVTHFTRIGEEHKKQLRTGSDEVACLVEPNTEMEKAQNAVSHFLRFLKFSRQHIHSRRAIARCVKPWVLQDEN